MFMAGVLIVVVEVEVDIMGVYEEEHDVLATVDVVA